MKKFIPIILWLTMSLVWVSVFAIDVKIGSQIADDPYYQMTPSNLNTMNSYIIPDQTKLTDTSSYPQIKYTLQKNEKSWLWYSFVKDTSEWYKAFHMMSSYVGFAALLVLFIAIWFFGVKNEKGSFWQVLRLAFDGIRETFDELLWPKASYHIKMYIVWLFFIVLISNLFGVFSDIIRFIFPQSLRYISAPTGEFETTLALAIVATLIPLWIQAKQLWASKFLLEYVPITGKWLIEGKSFGAKLGDIVISMFVWLLDIIGVISKIISLSMRLFGNMSSWGILLNVAFLWLWWLFVSLIDTNLVIGIPIILYLQGMLVAVVQAFVFAMLTSIGIKLVLD